MNSKIGSAQASMLLFNAVAPTALIVLPLIIGTYAEQDAPLVVLISLALGLGVAGIVAALIRTTNGMPLLDWVRKLGSPALAFLLGLMLLQYYLDATATILREYINFLKDNVLQNTPASILLVVILGAALYITGRGIESVARVNSIVVLLLMLFLPVFLAGVIPLSDSHNLLPFFDHSAAALTKASLMPVGWMSEIAVLLLLAPYLKTPQRAWRIGMLGLLYIAGLLMLAIFSSVAVFGPYFVKMSAYPGFAVISVIHLGRFIEQLDILFISYWILMIYIKLALFLFACQECLKQTFRLKEREPYHWAIALIVGLECTYTWQNPSRLSEYNTYGRFPVFYLINILLPAFLLLYGRIRGGRTAPAKEEK
ncbi:GerAB/ArcD/ProY family transporter [Paenibacillus spiritus]|uniref:GerAB/ArcD/ProY family transporter n=1 Tax=Paenibacillus spiritus TaxID=2496557 RepID=A0A5J5GA65_9BACL|nr:endospore germination permease [Paenibacillus spiritus]KAA9004850.1 GerAB/ArcD/ProY family transporter [Paenibacillus spiritus]